LVDCVVVVGERLVTVGAGVGLDGSGADGESRPVLDEGEWGECRLVVLASVGVGLVGYLVCCCADVTQFFDGLVELTAC
jgi:hypothetical protein